MVAPMVFMNIAWALNYKQAALIRVTKYAICLLFGNWYINDSLKYLTVGRLTGFSYAEADL